MRSILFAAFLSATLFVPAFADEGCCPAAGAEHEKLYYFIGEWTAEETWTQSEASPIGGSAIATYDVRRTMKGMFVEMEYSTRLEQGEFMGKAIFGWDAASKTYKMYWFDASGACMAQPFPGTWKGNALVFEGTSECGGVAYRGRYTYEVKNHNEFVFKMECAQGEGELVEMMTSTVRRIGGRMAAGPMGAKKPAPEAATATAEMAPAEDHCKKDDAPAAEKKAGCCKEGEKAAKAIEEK